MARRGRARHGGVVYTQWGRTTCPDTTGAELVYAGRMTGTYYNEEGQTTCVSRLAQTTPWKTLPVFKPTALSMAPRSEMMVEGHLSLNTVVTTFYVQCVTLQTEVLTCCTLQRLWAPPPPPLPWTRKYIGYILSRHVGHNRGSFIVAVRAT